MEHPTRRGLGLFEGLGVASPATNHTASYQPHVYGMCPQPKPHPQPCMAAEGDMGYNGAYHDEDPNMIQRSANGHPTRIHVEMVSDTELIDFRWVSKRCPVYFQ